MGTSCTDSMASPATWMESGGVAGRAWDLAGLLQVPPAGHWQVGLQLHCRSLAIFLGVILDFFGWDFWWTEALFPAQYCIAADLLIAVNHISKAIKDKPICQYVDGLYQPWSNWGWFAIAFHVEYVFVSGVTVSQASHHWGQSESLRYFLTAIVCPVGVGWLALAYLVSRVFPSAYQWEGPRVCSTIGALVPLNQW